MCQNNYHHQASIIFEQEAQQIQPSSFITTIFTRQLGPSTIQFLIVWSKYTPIM